MARILNHGDSTEPYKFAFPFAFAFAITIAFNGSGQSFRHPVGCAAGDHFKIVPEDEKERRSKFRYRQVDLFPKADPRMWYYESDKRKAG